MLSRQLDPQKQKKYLETIQQESSRLTNLINNFWDIQRIESGQVSYETSYFDLLPVCKGLAELFQHESSKHEFLVRDNSPLVVSADLSKVKQVMSNLLSNAVKYSPACGKIIIELAQENEMLHLSISDQGLGFSKESLEHILERFCRMDNSDRRNIGGTGLGLAIVKELVENMHGTVWAESKLEKGSTFHILLPRGEEKTNQI